jgi:type III secretion system YscD/HrpQ family protein
MQTVVGSEGQSPRAASNCVSLVVVGGLHDGAITVLGEGSHLIGSAAHCDLVFQGSSVAPELMLVSVSSVGAFVRPLAPGLCLAGKALPLHQNVPVHSQLAFSAGGIKVGACLGDDMSLAAAFASRLRAELDVPRTPRLIERFRSAAFNRPIAATMLALFGLAGVGLAASAVARGQLLGLQGSVDSPLEETRRKLSGLPMKEMRVDRAADHGLVVSGYAQDASALQRAKQSLGSLDLRWSVYTGEELVRFARDWLGSQGYRVDVQYQGAGVVAVSGQDTGRKGFGEAVARLPKEIPGLASVETTITPWPEPQVPKPVAAKVDEPFVLSGFNGINSGHAVPYITSGNTYIFQGATLKNGMSVVGIAPDRVMVDDRGTTSSQQVRIR